MYNFTTFDVVGDWIFGESLFMLDKTEYDPWVTAIFESLRVANLINIINKYPLIYRLFERYKPTVFTEKAWEHVNHSATRVTKRLQRGRNSEEDADLWNIVFQQKEGRGLSREEMDSNASLFMIAGTETTATLLSGMTYLLLAHPESLTKLTNEIRGSFNSAADITMERLATLPYLNACIKESFRIYPPVPTTLPRVTPDTGSTICGAFVPPHTIVGIPQRALFLSESNFKRAMEFLPQRWLGDSEFEHDQKHCLQPFSIGSRDCLGKNMAYHEIRLIAANIIYHFDLELCPESQNWTDQDTYILWEKKPLMCKVKPVK